MTMVVKNNLGAIRTLNQVNKNNSALKSNLEKIATGIKLNSAETDASAYAVSRKMQAQIRALDQDQQNTQNARSLLKIAEGGIQDIVEELRTIKELAINAANDTNTDEDRLTLQKELYQRRDTINDLATETNYNGKRLLDGSCALKEIEADLDPHSVSDAPEIIISEDGVYDISGTDNQKIKIQAQNVKLVSDGTDLNEVQIQVETEGANLYIQEVHITNSNGNCINFTGGGDNTLTILGGNKLATTDDEAACINIGETGSLSITEDTESLGASLETSAEQGAGIGTDYKQNTSAANIIIKSGEIKSTTTAGGAAIGSGKSASAGNILIAGGNVQVELASGNNNWGAAIGAGHADNIGGNSSVGNIEITGGTVTANISSTGSTGAAIGAGLGTKTSTTGKIIISGGTVTAQNAGSGAAIGGGQGKSSTDDIIISGGNVSATQSGTVAGTAAAIGSNSSVASSAKIVITGGSVNATSTEGYGAAIGSGGGTSAKIGDILIYGGNVTATSGTGGAAIGAGYQGKASDIIIADATVNATTVFNTATSTSAAIGSGSVASSTVGDIIICSGNVTATSENAGAAIGSGRNSNTSGKIVILDGTVNATAIGSAAAIGSGSGSAANIGNIEIYGGDVTATSETGGAAIGAGTSSKAGNIIITDGNVTATSKNSVQGSAIGGGNASTVGSISIYGGTVTASIDDFADSYAAVIGAGYAGKTSDINIYGGSVNSTGSTRGAAIGTAYAPSTTSVGNINIAGGNVHAAVTGGEIRSSWLYRVAAIGKYDSTSASVGTISVNGTNYTTAVDDAAYNTPDKKDVTITLPDNLPGSVPSFSDSIPGYNIPGSSEVPDTPENVFETGITYDATNILKFQTGSRANQNVTIGISDMHTKSLKSKIPSEADLEQLQEMIFNQKAYDAFKAILDEAEDKTLDDISFVPRKNAQVAIKVIDGAIDYALNEATNVGAFSSRLEITEKNIVTSAENLQAADSVINDTDMAKEMTAYTKNNVLLQASQSMLAQANQNASSVLGLLE